MQHGFHVAQHALASKKDWKNNTEGFIKNIESSFVFPLIAKPVDDGCSSAVKIIRSKEELEAYVELTFRNTQELDARIANFLKIKEKEEFPRKKSILIESLITAEGAARFIEITGGMLTSYDDKGKLTYEVFEASEALSEGDVLSLEEKFLAGQGQNITPARYSTDATANRMISTQVKVEFERAAKLLNIEGYARIDAFVRIYDIHKVETIFIEVNSLPGMTQQLVFFIKQL
jgi:D-alanine-D-alanine ligase